MTIVSLAALMATLGSAQTKLQPYDLTLPGSVVKIHMIPVEGGAVTIRGKKVTLKPYWIAQTDTAWEAFDAFLSSGPSSKPYDQEVFAPDAVARPSKSYILPDLGWGHHGYPVINVSITNVTMFCRWVAQATKQKYRLPTEAEWQFACQGGSDVPFKPAPAQLGQVAWYAANSDSTTHPIKQKAPNKLGLYDMLGDVADWAIDLDDKPVLCGASFQDPAAQVSSLTRKYYTLKWQEEDPQLPKSRWWLSNAPFAGFRIVCEAP